MATLSAVLASPLRTCGAIQLLAVHPRALHPVDMSFALHSQVVRHRGLFESPLSWIELSGNLRGHAKTPPYASAFAAAPAPIRRPDDPAWHQKRSLPKDHHFSGQFPYPSPAQSPHPCPSSLWPFDEIWIEAHLLQRLSG